MEANTPARGERRRTLGPIVLPVLLAGLLAGGAATAPAWSPAASGGPPAKLYISNGPSSTALAPLDPTTLADLGQTAIEPGRPGWVLSADGSTLVTIVYPPAAGQNMSPNQITIAVHDGLDGPERARYHPPVAVTFPRLSADGTRLVVMANPGMPGMSGPPPVEWYVLDTATGQVLATVRGADPNGWQSWLAPDARRLYQLVVPNAAAGGVNNSGPRPVMLVAYDLTSGEAKRLALPDVLAGFWRTGRTARGEPVMAQLSPGVALSPDGRTLAVVHADTSAITLVDAARLTVERTVSFARPPGLLAWLGLAPQVAEAKESEGTMRQAIFAPDGQRLYVWGSTSTIGNDGAMTVQSTGLRVIDLARGRLVAEALAGASFVDVFPAPDGRSVYVGGFKRVGDPVGATTPYLVWRLDAATLAIQAERAFTGWRRLVLVPTAPPPVGRPPASPTPPLAALTIATGASALLVGDWVPVEARFTDPTSGRTVEPGQSSPRYDPPSEVAAKLTPLADPSKQLTIKLDAAGYGVYRGGALLALPGDWSLQVIATWADGRQRGAVLKDPLTVQQAFLGNDGRRYLARVTTDPTPPLVRQPATLQVAFVDAATGAPLPASVTLTNALPDQLQAACFAGSGVTTAYLTLARYGVYRGPVTLWAAEPWRVRLDFIEVLPNRGQRVTLSFEATTLHPTGK